MRWSDGSQENVGVAVTAPHRDALLTELSVRLATGQGFSVATLNLDHVTKLRSLSDFRAAYLRHTHVTADGNPIVWLSRLAGQDVSLIPGSELITPVADLAAKHDVSVALFGATEASLQLAARALETQIPGLRIAATIAPSMEFDPIGEQAEQAILALRMSGAGLCFIALGAPKQEIFAAHAQDELPHMGFLSIGAGLDFISGEQVRAPRLVRALAAEWVWRLVGNPRRLVGRYSACIAIFPYLLYRSLKIRFQAGG
jgi:exopolysaccharide biosynthesis WecB/TagA/CpsF family protein